MKIKHIILICFCLVFRQTIMAAAQTVATPIFPRFIDFFVMRCNFGITSSDSLQAINIIEWDAVAVDDLKLANKKDDKKGLVFMDKNTRKMFIDNNDNQEPAPVVIILARDRSDRFIREAIEDKRFVNVYGTTLKGNEYSLKKLVSGSLDFNTRLLAPEKLMVEITNKSSFPFEIALSNNKGSFDKQALTIAPYGKEIIYYTTSSPIVDNKLPIDLAVKNAIKGDGKALIYNLKLLGMPYAVNAQPKLKYTIIPEPLSLTEKDGEFILPAQLTIATTDKNAKRIIPFLTERLQTVANIKSKTVKQLKAGEKGISFVPADDSELGKEGYLLSVTPNEVVVKANNENGFFYAVQTLLQLLPPQIYSDKREYLSQWNMPAVEIKDIPRFGYRGMMLDIGRFMYPISFVKKFIDLMAAQKMNTFHWHLTDDQGWRIEMKKHPELIQKGSMRKETIANRYVKSGATQIFDGQPYGGYYTQDEVREIVAYAKERCIEVIPEVDMPGHMLAALTTYPHLGCTGGPYEVGRYWGVYDDVLCAGNEKIYTFIQDVLQEVFDLFPSEYVHIGGDECPKVRWEKCPKCQAKIKAEGLKDEKELQSYVIKRIEKFLNNNGKKLIGWDEILEGGIAPNATLMSWRGEAGGITAARSGHPVIMTPNTYIYLDHYQANPEIEPMANGRIASLEWTYGYNPIPSCLTESEGKNIIGVQANVWTEYIRTPEQLEYMAYPRAGALAEIAWSPQSKKDWEFFLEKMQTQFERWRYMGVNYATHYKLPAK